MTTYSTGVDDLTLIGVTPNTRGYFIIQKVEPTYGSRIITTNRVAAHLDDAGNTSWEAAAGDVIRIRPVNMGGLRPFYALTPDTDLTVSEAWLEHQVSPDTWEPVPDPTTALEILTQAGAARDAAVESADDASGFADDAEQALADLEAQKGQPGGIANLDEDGDVVDGAGIKLLNTEAASAAYLGLVQAAKNPDTIITGAITRNGDGAVTSAAVVWPNGVPGTFTADTLSTAFPGAIDGYHITYGSPVTATFTQPTLTRDASGAAITVPAIVVS